MARKNEELRRGPGRHDASQVIAWFLESLVADALKETKENRMME